MKIKEIIKITNAKVFNCPDFDFEVHYAFTSDLMSDVLLNLSDYSDIVLLISGLNNTQLIRTAEVLDLKAIILVRGKTPSPEIIELAKENEIILLGTNMSAYKTSGELYKAGLNALF